MTTHEYYMHKALQEARQAAEEGEIPVGAVGIGYVGSVRSEKFTIQQLLPGKVKDFSRITARKAGLLYQSFEYDIEWIVIKIFG